MDVNSMKEEGKKKILFLTDDRLYYSGKFTGGKGRHIFSQVDISQIICELSRDFTVEQSTYRRLDLRRTYHGWYVVYGSTEERGLFYKGYIEDILLRLYLDGAVLVPGFEYFRAHGNKSFQEILRKRMDEDIDNLDSQVVGRFDELDISSFHNYPYVVKASAGSGSAGVVLAHTAEELKLAVRKLSRVKYYDADYTKIRDMVYLPGAWRLKTWLYKWMKKSQKLENPKRWFYANKVIVQEYIKGLKADYKVLYFSGKYYVLKRQNRNNDFRASGSGKFSFPKETGNIESVLNYARLCTKEIQSPMISMDIARKEGKCYLIEFQCLCFGPYTIQYARWHFVYDSVKKKWKRRDEVSDLEKETARSIKEFILS